MLQKKQLPGLYRLGAKKRSSVIELLLNTGLVQREELRYLTKKDLYLIRNSNEGTDSLLFHLLNRSESEGIF